MIPCCTKKGMHNISIDPVLWSSIFVYRARVMRSMCVFNPHNRTKEYSLITDILTYIIDCLMEDPMDEGGDFRDLVQLLENSIRDMLDVIPIASVYERDILMRILLETNFVRIVSDIGMTEEEANKYWYVNTVSLPFMPFAY